MTTADRYSTFDYSRLIDWEPRLRREWRFLGPLLATAPARSVIDLGAGSGEHARFVASHGYDVLGIDSSPAMLEKARAAAARDNVAGVTFVEGDMLDVGRLAGPPRGAAICVGNALPHLLDEDSLHRLAAGLRQALLPGGVFVLQLLNYDRFEAKNERFLPLSMIPDRDEPGATIVFLRTMEMLPGRRVIFMPTVLVQRPDREPPLELAGSQRVEIRGWRQDEIESALRGAGFGSVETFGSYDGGPFEKADSRDVIVVARA